MADLKNLGLEKIIFAFFFFAFSGWAGECIMESVVRKKFVNKGFFRGPYVPVHGFGAFAVYAAGFPFKANPFLVFLAGLILCTAIEYIAALILEKVFNVKCWDYETYPFTRWCHYKRRIALTTSVFFGLVTLALVYFYWDACAYIMDRFGKRLLIIIDSVLAAVFIADAFMTGKKYLGNRMAGISVRHSNDFSEPET
jgi:uncharacterized membrane protein